MDSRAVAALEQAKRSPDLPMLVRVARAVGVTPAALLEGIGDTTLVKGPHHKSDPSVSPASYFAINLRWARQRLGISQEHLAVTARADRAAISLFEHARRDPNLRTILKLAHALEVPAASLVAGMEASNAPSAPSLEDRRL